MDITLTGEGIVLQPSLFWTGHPLVGRRADGRMMLIYPAVTPLPLLDAPSSTAPLRRFSAAPARTPWGTWSAGTRPPTSPGNFSVTSAAASMQTKALREAGLIASQRDGKAVWHCCTPLGLDLLATSAPG